MASSSADKKHPETPSSQLQALQEVIDGLKRLSHRVSQPHPIAIDSNITLLNSVTVGDGFVPGKAQSEDGDIESDNEAVEDDSLFLGVDEPLPKGDSEYRDEKGLQEDDEDLVDEDDEDSVRDLSELVDWLNALKPHILGLHSVLHGICPSLRIQARNHQLVALGKVEFNRTTDLKDTMIADPMGLGKTLVAIMALANAAPSAKRFSMIVATSSCIKQWEDEITKFLQPNTLKILVLRDPNTSPLELLKYDVLLISYHFVMAQYKKMMKFLKSVEQIKQGVNALPKRPNTTIFSDIFYSQDTKCPYLVLDEVTAVKNTSSATFLATEELKSLAESTIMLTGSPVDNTWFDLYAYTQLIPSHDIRSKLAMRTLFARKMKKGRWGPPVGNGFRRLVQLLNSFVVRRPESVIALPPLQTRTVKFCLTYAEAAESELHYSKYITIINANSGSDGVGEFSPWGRLTLALQAACHPALEKIMNLVKNPDAELDGDLAAVDAFSEAKEIEQWVRWKEEIEKNENWRSSRIDAIIDILNEFRDKDPTFKVIIFDESVYFLDIVEVALSNMFEPEACLRYDGRTIAEKRAVVLEEFSKPGGPRVLLASRGAGGIGLNITAANKVILCGPWWKTELEEQAIKRAHRPGQKRAVEAVKLEAYCSIEGYKAGVRSSKHKHNSKIVEKITRADGELPNVYDDL
ncbi:hypothetical protein ONS95_000396 [Cadophora gregata]|uniref:uncharacterized protein n=1 Tax=Cadophora gregata TaxID=51156 RepID=UPI0026DC1766|nr:uncharacterized protein ONS95_000396 [Cadophora gregata]KAK0125596.1 hypothetical protein ONS96_009431 [Cadophora gregata f. sp. sojae]KAK0128423.1 hypothetical protein ONS95_000396 [Cadophora gregata]